MHEERRRRVLEAMGSDAVALFLGAKPVLRSADTEYPFRQDSDFHYLTGFDHPNAAAVLRADGGPAYTLFVEPHDPDAETWTGRRPGVEGARADYGADEAFPISELSAHLPKLVEGARRLYYVFGRDTSLDARLVETLESTRLRARVGVVPPEAIVDPRRILHEMRLHKDPSEIEILRRAAAITREAHAAAARLAQPGAAEFELEAELAYEFRRRGAAGPAYPSIVGSGPNATVLHYTENARQLRANELVLIDAGCELEGYASDVTRCYPTGGRFEGAARALYEVVLEAQTAGLDVVKPGATLEDVHTAALRRLVQGLVDLGLLAGTVDALIENGRYRRYYMHRTSHWLGLDVHDVGIYVADGRPRPLEPGMVLTVEPGLYVAPQDAEAPERFRGIGVRIEDDVLVTPNAHENLTAGIPKRPEDVEAWVRSG